MSDIDLIRTEVKDMSDREILLELLRGQRVQNGALAKHSTDLYGDKDRNIIGVKPLAYAHEIAIDRFRTRFQTLIAVAVFVGVGNFIALLTIVR